MKKLLFIFSLISVLSQAQNLTLQWAKPIGGANTEQGNAITTDASGNVYSTGFYVGVTDFDPGAGTFTIQSQFTTSDIYISKLNAAGNFVWAKSIGGANADMGKSIVVDASGNVYFTGEFDGIVDFDPGVGTFTMSSVGGQDIFVCKLDASGNFVWAKSIGGASSDIGNSIALDPAGNVYVTGNYFGTVDFDPGVGTYTLAAAGGQDVFAIALNPSGNFVAAVSLGGPATDSGNSIKLDGTGNVLIGGAFGGTADLDPGAGTYTLASTGGTDIFVCKISNTGSFVWAKKLGGASNDVGSAMAIDASNNIYSTGYFYGTGDFDPGVATYSLASAGQEDAFVSKLDASGSFVWAASFSSTTSEAGTSIAVDGSNNIYIAGYFNGTTDFDPGAGVATLTTGGGYDFFINKIDALGNFVIAKTMGSAGTDMAYGLHVDGSANVYTTGYFMATVDFDPNSGVSNLGSAGIQDVFVHKMNPCNSPVSPINTTNALNQSICPGQSTTLTATSSGTINWYSSLTSTTVLLSGASFNTPTLTVGTYTYFAEANTCTNSISRSAITVTVFPTPTVVISASSNSVCEGGTVSLLASGANSYSWNTGPTTNTIAVTPTVGNMYTVTGTSLTCSSSNTISITIIPNPTITISVSANTICAGGSAILSIVGAANSYTWHTGPTTTSISVSPTMATTYTAAGFNGACYGIATTTIYVSNNITVSTSVSNQTICSGESTTITTTGASTYTWSTGSNSTTIVVSPTITTTYSVIGINGSCSDTANVSVVVNACVGIHENSNDINFLVYPNPSNDIVIVEAENISELQIVDVLGKLVLKTTLQKFKNFINISNLPVGVYYFKIKQGVYTAIKKIIKQ